MKSLYRLIIYSLGAIWLPARGQISFDEKMNSLYKNTVPLIRAVELKYLDNKDIYIMDTRAPAEYQVSHIPGALMIDYDHFKPSDVEKIPRDAQIIVYCSVGYRSERIGEKLQNLGFLNVKNLYGGIFDWKNQGYKVYNSHGLPTDSVHTYNENWSQWLHKGIKVYE